MRLLFTTAVLLLVAACTGEGASKTVETESAAVSEAPAAATIEPVATEIVHADVPAAVQLLEQEPEVVVLDVRTPGEFEAGHIAGAINVDFKSPDFEQQLGELDTKPTYLVLCASGGRSTKSLPMFEEAGFARVVHLDGGMRAWTAAEQPVEQ